MRTFIVWAVYGYDAGGSLTRLHEYAYRDENEAREHATRVPNGYVQREKTSNPNAGPCGSRLVLAEVKLPKVKPYRGKA